MGYSFLPHIGTVLKAGDQGNVASTPSNVFALIDAGSLINDSESKKTPVVFLSKLNKSRKAALFEETFAKAATHLSPVLIELDSNPEDNVKQLAELDQQCQHLPVMAILHSKATLAELTEHLRSVLLVDAENVPYLLRFADTQMLAAANAVFTPAQRALFFKRIDAWYIVDHEGRIDDAASPATYEQSHPACLPSLSLDEPQTTALITAAAAPILASQLRNLDIDFRQRLHHAAQIGFACKCIADAAKNENESEVDGDLFSFAMSRWQSTLIAGAPI